MSVSRGHVLFAFVTAACLLFGAAVQASDSNKWRIKFDGEAKSDGVIVFAVRPKDGEEIRVETAVEKGTNENAVAKAVTKSFKDTLPGKHFHVERDDWEDVLVKKDFGEKNFELVLVSSSVESLGIRLKKE